MFRISRTGFVLAIVAILVSAALVLVVNATADAQEYDTYIVKEGDVLARIASAHDITVQELMQLNNLTSPILIRRQVLKVPAKATEEPAQEEEMAPDPTETAGEMTAEATAEATEEPAEATEEPTAEAPTESAPTETAPTVEAPPAEPTEEATEEPAAEATVEAPAGDATPLAEGVPVSTATPDASGTATDGGAASSETMTDTVEATAEPTEEAAGETAEAPVSAVEVWAAPESGAQVVSPAAGGAYHSPIAISGLTGALSGEIVVRLIDSGEEPLAERTVAVDSPDSAGFFDTYLRFTVTDPVPATLQVTAGDSEPVEIPVILLPGQRFIDLDLPTNGTAVCSPILVAGYSSTFEANVVVEVTHADGTQLMQEPTTGGSMGVYSEFSIELEQSVDEPHPLIIAAYETDASGMYPSIDHTAVPVTLFPAGSAACSQ